MKKKFIITLSLLCSVLVTNRLNAQVSYSAAGSYGLRLINPSYKGSAINVRRSCDNLTKDIGFSCGALNTAALNAFVVGGNPLTAISSNAATAYSLRKLSCSYAGSAVNVRRSCDNAVKDIGFTASGDFDTTSLQKFVFQAYPLTALSATAAAAYSLRKLYCSYAGKAINVRSSAVGTPTMDIGFTANGDLDTATLKTFIGANNGFIATWYDQSGNANNVTQATTTAQPQLVNAGVIYRQNTMPTAVFNGTSSYLSMTYSTTLNVSAASTCNAVVARTGAAGGTCDAIYSQQYTGNNIDITLAWNSIPAPGNTLCYGYYVQGGAGWQNAELPTDVALNTDNIITGTILSGAGNTTTIKLYDNGTLSATASNQATVGAINTAYGFNVGKRWDLANYAPINLQELIVFASVLSTTDRQYLEFSQSAYYSISGPPSLSAIPANAQSAYVATWYDQSLNALNATATTANQPRIMNAGVIDRQNGLPAIYFNNTGASGYNIGLQTSSFSMFSSAAFFLGVSAVNSNLTYNALVTKTGTGGNANQPCPFDFYYDKGGDVTKVLTGNGNAGSATILSTTIEQFKAGVASGNLSIWTYEATTAANSVNAFYNATTQIITNQSPAGGFGDQSTPLCLGFRSDGTTGLNGWLSEVLTFSVIPSATDIGYLEYTEGAYFGISGPTLGTLPASPASAYVTTWYDQSGNGNNATQATIANQPMIVNAGVIQTQNALPTLKFNGTSQYLTASAFTTVFNNTVGGTLNVLGANNGASTVQGMAQQGRSAGTYWGIWGNATDKYTAEFSPNPPANLTSAIAASTFKPVTLIQLPGVSTTLYENGTSVGTSVSTSNESSAQPFTIGLGNTGEYWNGTISEVNVFASGLNSSRRGLFELNQASYYGLTIAITQYTPASGYNLFVDGIGVAAVYTDSVEGTHQSVGMGFIDNGFLKDVGDAIIAGTTCLTNSVTTSLNMPAGATAGYERWLNDWYINKTDVNGNGGNLKIYFDFSDYGVSGTPATAANYQLWSRASTAANFAPVAGTTVAISGNRVIFTVPSANIATTGYYTIGTIDYKNSPLPIELLYFSATAENNAVDLSWATATETNNNYFTIERSKDGVVFDFLKQIPSEAINGNSTTTLNYKTYDLSPFEGINYYRLKQTDRNGNYTHSNVVQANFTNRSFVSVFPNPGSNNLYVNVSADYDQAALKLLDALGREVLTQNISASNVNSINTSVLTSGMYVMVIDNGNGKVSKVKITIQK